MQATSLSIDEPPSAKLSWPFPLGTYKGALATVLLLRLIYGLLAVVISATFPHTQLEQSVSIVPGSAPIGTWLQRIMVEPWMRYDSWSYKNISEAGYIPHSGTAAFHPLYPLIATPFRILFGGNTPLALLLISTAATVVSTVLLWRYVAKAYDKQYANLATGLLLVFPPAFIFVAPYTESTFMALSLACIIAIRGERWWLAGLFGGLAALTRQQGIVLILPLCWQLAVAIRAGRTSLVQLAAVVLIPLGYGLFIAYRAITMGDLKELGNAEGPLQFVHALMLSHSSKWVASEQTIAMPWVPFTAQVKRILAVHDYAYYIDLILGLAGALVFFIGWKKLNMIDRLYALSIIMIPLCYYNGHVSPYLSLPRHVLLAFPIFIILAYWLQPRPKAYRSLAIFFLINFFLTGAYIRTGWIP